MDYYKCADRGKYTRIFTARKYNTQYAVSLNKNWLLDKELKKAALRLSLSK